ncbi:MAG: HAD-IC family P-type ATPase [Bacilli bacterium]|nr:HAD-IC family P-type ATPase [Bacilli bacterium]
MNYELMNSDEVISELVSDKNGLTDNEVKKRLVMYGKNILPKEKKDSIYKIFFSQFANAITLILVLTCIFSFMVNEIVDGIAIVLIIMIDVIMGTIQEYKAKKSAESLSNMIKVNTKVLRNGREKIVDSEDLVVGDIFYLESGDKVSADARIIECNNLSINESMLTGESNAIFKNSSKMKEKKSISESVNMVYAGTSVITGRAKCIAVGTGSNTEIGRIATTVIDTKNEDSPLTIRMNKFTKQISIAIVCVSIVLLISLYIKGAELKEMFLSVVALSVSAMPEGLPLALTLALTIGANRMSKKKVIVKQLNAVEALGSCSVIASDKTGTLTVNEQTLKKIILPNDNNYEITGSGYNDNGKVIGEELDFAYDIIKYGVINNESGLVKDKNDKWVSYGDSIDIAFLACGKKSKVDISNVIKLGGIPYESINKYSCVFYKEDDRVFCTVKGSVEVVLELCNKMNIGNKNVELDSELIDKQSEKLASDGYRVLAIAYGEVSNFEEKSSYSKKDIPKLSFIGLCGFVDPVRKEVKKSIDSCLKSGIKVVMITGDHPITAYSIAKTLDLASDYSYVTTGEEIEKYKNMSINEFDNFIKSKTVFSRVTPLQKLEIVESYKRQGEFVAVTGDGVNDAPALKSANIGVAMGSGTDVAKETSNMIIVDNNFMSIVSAVEEGRNAYANIRKVLYMLLSCGLAEVLAFVLAILFDLPMPLVAVQLLWLNIVTDGLQDLALSFEKEKLLDRKSSNNIFDKQMIEQILVSGLFMGIISFIVFAILIKKFDMQVSTARGYVMALVVFMQNMHVLNCRSEYLSVFNNPIKNNVFVLFSIISAIILQIIVMEVDMFSMFLQTTSIPFVHLIFLFLASLPILLIMEMYKEIKKKKN